MHRNGKTYTQNTANIGKSNSSETTQDQADEFDDDPEKDFARDINAAQTAKEDNELAERAENATVVHDTMTGSVTPPASHSANLNEKRTGKSKV